LGIDVVYAADVDQQKRHALKRLGLKSKTVLPRHYRVKDRFYDCEIFEAEFK
jgi:hypothetical protein